MVLSTAVDQVRPSSSETGLPDPARAVDDHVVGRAFTRAVEPRNEEVAVGQLDDRGRVVVPVLQREDQLGAMERLLGEGGSQQHKRCDKEE